MSGKNNISKNSITENTLGVWIISTNNQIIRNDVLNNTKGVLVDMGKNKIYYNNFVNNTVQAEIGDNLSEVNVWDQGTTGNYWSNYNRTGPYIIGKNDQDNYPLTQPTVISEFSSFALLWGFTIIIIFIVIFKTMCHSRLDT